MNENNCSIEDRLPMFHRTVKLPNGLWDKVKELGKHEKKSSRWIVDEALDTELIPLIESLRELGLKGEIKADKLVRVPLDDNVIGRLNYARRQTGLPAVLLLRICLYKNTKRPFGKLKVEPQIKTGH
ncbi:MAG: hypothetical protein KAS96_06035 [Planctomycetes bacterium]|nr:hypothetical protein [Planctomycetota bacterium]